MSSVQHLREFIRERLTAAAQEIFTEVEKTIICYEEELDAQRRMMGINWKPEIKLHRVGSELQRQSSDLQKPRVSREEETFAIQQVCHQGRKTSHDEEEVGHQLTEKEQMEPEPPVKEGGKNPEPTWIKEEKDEPEPPLIKEKEEMDTSALTNEKPELEYLPTRHNQKDLCSSQEGEQLVQKQIVALIETSTLEAVGLSEEEKRTQQLSLHMSREIESNDQEESSSTVSESQSHTDTNKSSFKCDICGRCLKNQCNLVKHYRTHKDTPSTTGTSAGCPIGSQPPTTPSCSCGRWRISSN
ncbi:zinc finger protein 184-like isoform X2 [Poecilia reticulata]|uniref:zinc finger protein 184-like isoform X2 n=1 Tax=Poecilia reticulata TaxID=8081 RepID=UPI0004A47039|nr:PREDICTED: zinc finger protein 184-like isoform X2 [Poecilia reticulata]